MITGINESKTLTKYISCECKCKFVGTKCSSNQWWNKNKKKHHICEKDYVWDPATCNCENKKYLASIMDDSWVICDEVVESYNEEIKFIKKKAIYKTQNFYILISFLLVTIALLTAVSIYCYLIKYRGKHLLTFHNANNKLNKFYIDSIN